MARSQGAPRATPPTRGPLRGRVAVAWIVGLTCLAFLNSFGGNFVFDDVSEIGLNPALDRLFPPWEAMFRGQKAPARPLPYLTFAIDRAVWGRHPLGYHVTNVLVHLVAALALFDLTRLTLLSPRLHGRFAARAVPLAMAITILWAVHPLQTQSVTYVYQRIEAMVGMFSLLSLAAFARSMTAGWSRAWLAGSLAACAAAMACKENAVVVPPLLLLYDWFFSPQESPTAWRADAWTRRGFHAAAFLTWTILGAVIASQAAEYQEFGTAKRSPLVYALTQPGVIVHYLRLAFVPVGQCLDYSGWTAVERVSAAELPAFCLIAGVVAATLYGTVRRQPWAWLGVLFLGTLAPTSSVMPVEAFANEHRMYVPLAAVAATAVLGATEFGRRLAERRPGGTAAVRRAGLIAFCLAVTALVLLTHARNRLYFSSAAIWNDVLQHDPGNHRALWQFANMLDGRGDEAGAFELADRALERRPTCAIYGHLAAQQLTRGNAAAAELRCRRGLERQRAALPADHPAVLSATGDLAAALRMQGKVEEAEAIATAALPDMRRVLGTDDPVTLGAEQLVAEGLAKRGDTAAAEALARDVLARARRRRGDTEPIAINALVALSRVLDTAGKTAEAEQLVRQALERVVRKGSRRANDRLLLEDLRAEFLEKDGRVDEAVAVRRRLADATEDLHGVDNPMTATALTRHALAVGAQATARGDHATAVEIYGRIRDNYSAALGPEHPDTRAMEARWRAARERSGPNAPTAAPRSISPAVP